MQKTRVLPLMGAIIWICTLQFFFFSSIAAAQATPHYVWFRYVLSDLGRYTCGPLHSLASFCSPDALLYNSSLFVQGALITSGAWLMQHRLKTQVGTRACMIAGCSLFVIALDPENSNAALHIGAAILHCFAANIAVVVFALAMHRTGWITRSIMGAGMVLGIVGLLSTCLLGIPQLSNGLTGLIERCAVDPLPLMLSGFGLYFLMRRGIEPNAISLK